MRDNSGSSNKLQPMRVCTISPVTLVSMTLLTSSSFVSLLKRRVDNALTLAMLCTVAPHICRGWLAMGKARGRRGGGGGSGLGARGSARVWRAFGVNSA